MSMTDPSITLYHCPAACSQVTVCALEWAGLPYRLELVDVVAGAQLSDGYAAVTRMAKVPYMLIDGDGLGENVALISLIADIRPDAGLLPPATDLRARAEALSGLSFCSGTLHPIVRGLVNPQRVTAGDTAGVRAMSAALANKSFAFAEDRLARTGWWLGAPSIVDVYLNWALSVALRAQFNLTAFPQLASLPVRLETVPAFVAMQQEEAVSRAKLGR